MYITLRVRFSSKGYFTRYTKVTQTCMVIVWLVSFAVNFK